MDRDLSRINWEEFVHCQVRANETYSEAKRQFSARNRDGLRMPSLLISCGSLLSLLCSARVRHCHRLLVEVVYWCSSRLTRQICSRIILTASSPESLLICSSPAIRLRDLSPLPSGRARSGVSC